MKSRAPIDLGDFLQQKKSLGESEIANKAPTFEEVVSFLKKQGIKAIRKRKFCLLGEDMIPDYYLGKSFNLIEPQVAQPDFWVPIGFDGYAWRVFLCVPPWLEGNPIAPSWYHTWRDFFPVGSTAVLTEDPEHFVHSTLCDLIASMHSIRDQDGMNEMEIATYKTATEESHALLKRAMVEAYLLDQNLSSCDELGTEADRPLPLSNRIASVIELAFRAGRLSERGAWYGRTIPTVARKGMVLVSAQKTNAGPRLKWTQKAEELLIENPNFNARRVAIRLAEAEIAFTMDNWKTVHFEDETPSKSFKVFSRSISRIRMRLKKD